MANVNGLQSGVELIHLLPPVLPCVDYIGSAQEFTSSGLFLIFTFVRVGLTNVLNTHSQTNLQITLYSPICLLTNTAMLSFYPAIRSGIKIYAIYFEVYEYSHVRCLVLRSFIICRSSQQWSPHTHTRDPKFGQKLSRMCPCSISLKCTHGDYI